MSLHDIPDRVRYDFGGREREARVVGAIPFGKLPHPMELVYRVEGGHQVLESDAVPV